METVYSQKNYDCFKGDMPAPYFFPDWMSLVYGLWEAKSPSTIPSVLN